MSNQATYEELLEAEVRKYPSLLMWNNVTKLIAIVPAILYLYILVIINISTPDALIGYTLRGLIYFACYGGFLKTIFEIEKTDAFLVIFGLGTVVFFVNNLFYTDMNSILGILINLVIVWIAVCIYNYKKARNDAQMSAMEINRYNTTKKVDQADKEQQAAKKEARDNSTKATKKAVEELQTQASFSKAFEEFQKKNS